MLDAFEAGGDFHSRTAMNMYPHIRDAVQRKDVLLEWHPQSRKDKPPVPLLKYFMADLLYVEDNLGRASAAVKDFFSKIDETKDIAGDVQLLKTLLNHFEMTDKHLAEVMKKFGLRKSDPVNVNELFDPHRHKAVLQIPNGTKPPCTVDAIETLVKDEKFC